MALLDVTDVLLDPDFMDMGLACVRTTETVGDNGRPTTTTVRSVFAGVITSDSGDILERLAGGERKKGSITIHTIFQLTSGFDNVTADTVTWRGNEYVVSNVNDYAHFGRGFVSATCDLKPLAG
ncbi:hypothetical protein QN399_00920 [Pseudomonas sp. 10C3]|uniref:hypothetical protein n=1 Tax=Pseudomonas sp. 10C3 TaxID=3118753 RepID=UPI002E7FC829|nr:hypothetical protein [Pseudomonas sp. 10C3]MEE3504837.1 hypothetical protein [Pseudomonas sp. 10C3]